MIKLNSRVTVIAATDSKRGLGVKNTLPWQCKQDMEFFKMATMGKPVIMGRKTLESIGRPLKGRKNIVVSSNPSIPIRGISVASTLVSALKGADIVAQETGANEIVIIGGGSIYEQTVTMANEILLTKLPIDVGADTFFPTIPDGFFLYKVSTRDIEVTHDGITELMPVNFERWHRIVE